MIDRKFASLEAQKFGQLHFPPQTKIALDQLIDDLAAVSRSEQHCRQIVAAILENPGEDERWPTSKSIRDVAWNLLSEADRAVGCLKCNGTGWIHMQRMVGKIPYDYASPCKCRPSPPAEAPEKPREMETVASAAGEAWWDK